MALAFAFIVNVGEGGMVLILSASILASYLDTGFKKRLSYIKLIYHYIIKYGR